MIGQISGTNKTHKYDGSENLLRRFSSDYNFLHLVECFVQMPGAGVPICGDTTTVMAGETRLDERFSMANEGEQDANMGRCTRRSRYPIVH